MSRVIVLVLKKLGLGRDVRSLVLEALYGRFAKETFYLIRERVETYRPPIGTDLAYCYELIIVTHNLRHLFDRYQYSVNDITKFHYHKGVWYLLTVD